MGKYTALHDPSVDRIIETHMDLVTQKVVHHFHPRSVILSGSFGRGEGSVLVKGSTITFLSDYEVGVVTEKFWKRLLLDKVATELTSEIQVKTSLYWLTPSRVRSNRPKNLSFGHKTPTIYMYELKDGSVVLYGKNCLEENRIDPATIPLSEGIRLLLNRMADVLSCLPVSIRQTAEAQDAQKKLQLITSLNKMVLACADALLLSIGQYHYSYVVRMKRFLKAYNVRFSREFVQFPQFSDMVKKAVQFKLTPAFGYDSRYQDAVDLWFQIRPIVDGVFRYLLQCEGIRFRSYSTFYESYVQPATRLGSDFGYYHIPLLPSTFYQNIIAFWKITRFFGFPARGSLTRLLVSWEQLTYSLVVLLLFSVSSEYEIDLRLLDLVRDRLRLIMKLRSTYRDPLDEWSYLKFETLKLWQTIC